MIGRNILLWPREDSTTLKSTPSLGLRSTGLYFLGTCYPVYRWRIEFSVPLLSSLQLQSYLVPCISGRIFIIPKLQNIRYKQFLSVFFSLFIEHLPNCYPVRPSIPLTGVVRSDWCFWEHLSRALPTEMILNLLRSIRSERLMPVRKYSAKVMLDILEIIIMWLQVSR